MVQGDMCINDYCTKLKRIADQLRDIGHPVSEPSQVINLLRGLNPKFRYVKPVITSKSTPHTFQSARSFLILEELSFQHDATVEAGQALTAYHGATHGGSSSSSGTKDSSSGTHAPRSNNKTGNTGNGNSGSNRSNNRYDRRRGNGGGRNNGGGGSRSNNNANSSSAPSAPWATGYNPCTGVANAFAP
ncbi:uncharacterized protein [Miscanthus floridulus]|uniref:uncharacterized protein n=1 Tax=Miscanthus floridulus TaxID=154761 RepID=UPI00345A833A